MRPFSVRTLLAKCVVPKASCMTFEDIEVIFNAGDNGNFMQGGTNGTMVAMDYQV